MLRYPATLPGLSTVQLCYLAKLLRAHRQRIGSRWRKLSPGRQALLVLAYLRKNETYEALAAGFGIGVATAWRYIQEAVRLLADQAPTLVEACWQLAWSGSNFAFADGTAVPIDRVRGVPDPHRASAWTGSAAKAQARAKAERQRRARQAGRVLNPAADAARETARRADLNRLYFSGKHKRHTVNLQALVNPHGQLVWISDGLPGSVQDLHAARTHGVIDMCERAELTLLCDLGYTGSDSPRVLTGYKRPKTRTLAPAYRDANRALASIRARCEHGFAPFKHWRILHRHRSCPRKT
ncbi:transposase family protein, partial [Tenggerimyces flavus]